MQYKNKLYLYFLFDWCLIIGLFVLALNVSYWFWPLIAIAIGIIQHAIGEIGHNATHYKQNILAKLCFWPLCISLLVYRKFHFAHHRWLGIPDKDPEVQIVYRFKDRWTEPYKFKDSVFDVLGLHSDEAIYVLSKMSSVKIFIAYTLSLMFLIFINPVFILWPVGAATGLVLAHRLRARTEHQHLTNPGQTLESVQPTWKTFWYLPHGTWKHKEHHYKY